MSNLESIELAGNSFDEIDITPLLSCPLLEKVKIGRGATIIADSQKGSDIQSPRLSRMKKKIEWY